MMIQPQITRALLGLTLLAALCFNDALPATAQSDLVGVRYYGELRIGPGNRVPPEGTPIVLLATEDWKRYVPCAKTTTRANGRYEIDVPAAPDCISQVHGRRMLHIFMVHGEKVGFRSDPASLDQRRSLGRRWRQDLKATEIPGFDPSSWPADGTLVGVRYYGQAMIGTQPAPAGTEIRVLIADNRVGQSIATCGAATVTGKDGSFWLDVDSNPRCIPMEHGRQVWHIFSIRGEQVGSERVLASLDLPRSLGHTRRIFLRATPPFE